MANIQKGDVSFERPYAPSWFDRLTEWVDNLPGPAWAFYLLLAFVVVLIETAIQWREGAYLVGTFKFAHIWGFSFVVYGAAFIHVLDKIGANALETFRPLLSAGRGAGRKAGDTYQDLRYHLTTLPARSTAVATVIGGGVAILTYVLSTSSGVTPNYLVDVADTPLSVVAFMFVFVLGNAMLGVVFYHTIHQLVIVNKIYTRHARINLFQLQPLYALSRPGAVTTLGLSGVIYLFFLTTPEGAATSGGTRPFELALGGIFTLIAALTFFLPIRGAHRRIVAEKNRRIEETSSRYDATTQQLHHELDLGQLDNMGNLNRALASLESEHEFLKKIPTWPWEPGIARSVVFALLFPIITWLLQQLLGRFLGS